MTAPAHPAASTILPELVSARLEAAADTVSTLDWAIGDTVIELAAELAGHYSKAEITMAVATRAQLQPSAVRAREAAARFWDEAARAEYDGLTYSHFRLAMRQADPRADMDWCLSSADDFGGQPASYHVYAAMVRERSGGKDEPTVSDLLERAVAQLDRAWDGDPAAVLRELSRYVDAKAEIPIAGQATSDLRMAASELKTAAVGWGKER